MFPEKPPKQVREKPESEDCEIEVKKTKQGKRIKFKGKCTKEQIRMLAKENDIDLE